MWLLGDIFSISGSSPISNFSPFSPIQILALNSRRLSLHSQKQDWRGFLVFHEKGDWRSC